MHNLVFLQENSNLLGQDCLKLGHKMSHLNEASKDVGMMDQQLVLKVLLLKGCRSLFFKGCWQSLLRPSSARVVLCRPYIVHLLEWLFSAS